LQGDLNAGFTRLKKSTVALLEEMSHYSAGINISYVNPSEAKTEKERENKYAELQKLGMKPTMVYESDDDGKSVQKIIFPWLQIKNSGRVVMLIYLKM